MKKFAAENGIVYIDNIAYSATADLQKNVIIKEGTTVLCDCIFRKGIYVNNNWFYPYKVIESVSLPSSLLGIGRNAFFECQNLTSVKLLSSLLIIGDNAFEQCNLSSISLPERIQKLGNRAFASNPLTTVTLPENITFLGIAAFGYNNKLIKINYNCIDAKSSNEYYSAGNGSWPGDKGPFNGSSCNVLTIGNKVKTIPEKLLYKVSSTVSKISFPTSLERIEAEAFYDQNDLTEISLPESLLFIGDMAFYRTSLTSISLPENVNYIGLQAFNSLNLETLEFNCHNAETKVNLDRWGSPTYMTPFSTTLTQVKIGPKVEYIMPGFLHNCGNVSSNLDLSNVKEIGKYAFSNTLIKSVILNDKLEQIPDNAFSNCKSLKNVVIPANATKIGEEAFYGCDKAFGDNLSLPASLKTIGHSAFKLTGYKSRVFLPAGVEEIGANAFQFELQNLSKSVGVVYSMIETPVNFEESPFADEYLSTWKLVVPNGKKKAYSSAKYWRQFSEIKEQGKLYYNSNEIFNVNFEGLQDKSSAECNGIIIDGVYYSGIKYTEGSASLKLTNSVNTDKFEESLYGVDWNYYDITRDFSGVHMMLPPCKGQIEIDATAAVGSLEVRIEGDSTVVASEKSNRNTIIREFNLDIPTGLWIYIPSDKNNKQGVSIYSIKVIPEGCQENNAITELRDEPIVITRYLLNGIRVDSPAKGSIVVEILSDGSVRKVKVD